ncbi:MAG: hypothetical protein NC307_02690 [Roseburia sp.]|nr:hypothetical protein [Roseburia sp.]
MICFSAIPTEKDRDEFRKIYEENYLKMYHVAFGMIKNQADAENVVQEAFLSLAENFEKYLHLSGSEMTGLCVSIVKNKIIDMTQAWMGSNGGSGCTAFWSGKSTGNCPGCRMDGVLV